MPFWHRIAIAAGVFAAIWALERALDVWLRHKTLPPESITRYRVLRRSISAAILVVGFFSALLVISVTVLVVTGLYGAGRQVPEPDVDWPARLAIPKKLCYPPLALIASRAVSGVSRARREVFMNVNCRRSPRLRRNRARRARGSPAATRGRA